MRDLDRPIRIIIVDDFAAVRQGLRALLSAEPDMEVVGEAANGHQALRLIADLAPDVVILDLVMRQLNGLQTIQRLHAAAAPVKILVLTNFGDAEHVLPALQAGINGYLLKDTRPADVVAAVRRVHAGQMVLHPNVAFQLAQNTLLV